MKKLENIEMVEAEEMTKPIVAIFKIIASLLFKVITFVFCVDYGIAGIVLWLIMIIVMWRLERK